MKVRRVNNRIFLEDMYDSIEITMENAEEIAYDLLKEIATHKRIEHERVTAKRMVHD